MTRPIEEVSQVIRDMEKHCEAIENQIIDITYYMEGGISWTEAWQLSPRARNNIIEQVTKKLRAKYGDTKEYM